MEAEQTQANLRVISAFDTLRIPYFLGGSMASSIHGIYRATADADFIAAVRLEHADALVRLLQPDFYADLDAIRAAVASARSFNVIHLETMLKVDVFVAQNDPFSVAQMRRRVLQAVGDNGQAKFHVASPEDTVLAKLRWYRDGGGVSDRQWNDVQGVIKIQGSALDRDYLRDWAGKLNLADLLVRAFNDAGFSVTLE